ncbi:MAG: 4-oxalomesaconate tautomerase [Pseudomonadota bacterium]
MTIGVPATLMRGGTSRGLYFLADDLPKSVAERDTFLLNAFGSPDDRQINGVGGADPLTSKVGIVSKSERDGVDVDYLFLQVFVEQPVVTDAQNCGNILAGIGPFAIEWGLVAAQDGQTNVTIYMENTGQIAVATVETPNGKVTYDGDALIDGVPFPSAPIPLEFQDTAGSMCGALLPTGNMADVVDGVEVTLIDNGMPCVIFRAEDVGITGYEDSKTLEENEQLRAKLEKMRAICGPLMNLGDVSEKSVPKMTMVAAPKNGGTITTRSFIPHKCHSSIGVLAAVTVATACLMKGSPAHALAEIPKGDMKSMPIEHPIGQTTIIAKMDGDRIVSSAILRTARKIFDGMVFG